MTKPCVELHLIASLWDIANTVILTKQIHILLFQTPKEDGYPFNMEALYEGMTFACSGNTIEGFNYWNGGGGRYGFDTLNIEVLTDKGNIYKQEMDSCKRQLEGHSGSVG